LIKRGSLLPRFSLGGAFLKQNAIVVLDSIAFLISVFFDFYLVLLKAIHHASFNNLHKVYCSQQKRD
jgi:hypothetical protein